MRLNHPIFNQPLNAGVVLEANEWNRDYDNSGVWVVQTGKLGSEVDYGVVSDGLGFEDSPDCERISGGINSKGPRAVAIGRQANMLQWGFYAAPDRMTQSAQRAFLNALVYMQAFDGQRPLVEKRFRARAWVTKSIEMIDMLADLEGDNLASIEQYLKGLFPLELIEEHGLDKKVLSAWSEANMEYLRRTGQGSLLVDAELAELGVSNRQPAFLDLLVTRLTADPKDPLAQTLIERYLDQEALQDADPLAWIQARRADLFFSDTGGFRWFLGK